MWLFTGEGKTHATIYPLRKDGLQSYTQNLVFWGMLCTAMSHKGTIKVLA